MRHLLFLLFFISQAVWVSGQFLDLDLDFPVSFTPDYITQNNIYTISFVQSGENIKGDNIKKEVKTHRNGIITYYFDSTGVPFMKEITDKGYIDTFMMNGARCASKNDPDSRFYEPNVFCNDKGMVVANQTDKSNYFYRYDNAGKITQWVRIDHEEDEESNVFLTMYQYGDTGRLELIVEKEGELRFNLGTRLMDTIYKSSLVKKMVYTGDRMTAMVTYTNNNVNQVVASSTYKYKYKGDRLDEVNLYLADDKKSIYTFKVLKVESTKDQ